MGQPPDSPLGKLYKEHIGFILAKNVDGLLNQYAQDCLLISTLTDDRQPLYVRGHKELEEFFRSRIFRLQDLEIDLNQWAETENTLMIVENVELTGTDDSTVKMSF